MIDYILYLKVCAWVDAYFLPNKLNIVHEPDKRQTQINILYEDVVNDGYCCISQFNSITGKQEYFREKDIL